MGKLRTAYKAPQQYDVEIKIKLIDRIRVLCGSKLHVQTFVALPFRGDEPIVRSGVRFDKFFYKIGQRFKKYFAKEPHIKPLRGQRGPA